MARPAAFTAQHPHHVFETSRWQRLLWQERLDASASIKEAVGAVAHALVGGDPAGENGGDAHAEAADFGGELYGRLYDDPARMAQPEGAAWMVKSHDTLAEDAAEWKALRSATDGDPDMAALATRGLLRTVAEKLPALLKELDEETEEERQEREQAGLPGAADRMASAMRGAVWAAAEQVQDTKEALEGLAPGLGSAPPAGHEHDPRRLQLAERLKDDENLRDVLRKAGRIQRISRRFQQTRSLHAREEVVDLERGGDVNRILASGLARLRHPTLRLLAKREIVERTALQYRLEGKEPLGRGPIVVLLDESGSMSGEPHTWARAIGLAAIGQAAKEKRACTVLGFDYVVTSCHRLTVTGEAYSQDPRYGATRRRSPVSTEQGDKLAGLAELVLQVASIGTHGGTNFTQPMVFAMECGLREDRADFVFVTDGQADIAPAVLAELAEAKKRGLRVFGVVLNGGSASPAVRAICDSVVELDRASDPGMALGKGVL